MVIRGSVTRTGSTLTDCVTLDAVIAFLVAVADQSRFDAIAAPGIEHVREADSLVVTVQPEAGCGPQRALNAALDALADEPDLEAVVILHEDVVLLDPDTASIVRGAFADPAIAIAGAIGAQGVPGLAWWGGIPIGSAETAHVPDGVITGMASRGPVDAVDVDDLLAHEDLDVHRGPDGVAHLGEIGRERAEDGQAGEVAVPMEFRSEFLHAFMNTEQVKSNKPVELTRGQDRFSGDAMDFDNLGRVVELHGRVKGTLVPGAAR